MATLAAQKIKNKQNSFLELSPEGSSSVEPELVDLRFALADKLQTTLELDKIIELFFQHAHTAVSCSSVKYENADVPDSINIGASSKHTVAYNVSSKLEQLGTVTLSRSKPFLSTELVVLELLIGGLFFPLRNAILYQKAIANSMRDPLTGIGNRLAMDSQFGREVKLSKRQKTPLSIIVLDIDHFKQVNDTFGHHCGDQVLKHVAQEIRASLRETDHVFRYGGEEFLILLNGANMESAQMTAERIRLNISSNPALVENQQISSTLSLGVSSLAPNDDAESLFNKADQALYKAKSKGRNQVICSSFEQEKKNQANSVA